MRSSNRMSVREDSTMMFLGFNVQGALQESARACEQDVFLRAFGNTAEQLQEEYGPYDDQSVWLTVSDDEGFVLGSCRIITPGPAGLKTLNDVARAPWGIDGPRSARAAGADLEATWDIATLGVREAHRGSRVRVALALYHGILRAGRANGIRTLTAIFDEPARRVLAALDYRHVALPGTYAAPYLGSESSTPVYYHATMLDAARRENPEAYRLIIQGVGLDGVFIPDDASFVLPAAVPAAPGRTVAA
ncbi:MAG: hypothetical protein Q7V58_12800 [Actinomycetota bacterium]|nr:hypothetical protein [Actinomycetota bacterium]